MLWSLKTYKSIFSESSPSRLVSFYLFFSSLFAESGGGVSNKFIYGVFNKNLVVSNLDFLIQICKSLNKKKWGSTPYEKLDV